MDSKHFFLKFHHNGVFTTKKYLGGNVFQTTEVVDSDKISYPDLTSRINEDLKYDKIGGIYVWNRKNCVFKLLGDDCDLSNYMEDFKDGDTLVFFIDNSVDEMETTAQNQPFLSVQPRGMTNTAPHNEIETTAQNQPFLSVQPRAMTNTAPHNEMETTAQNQPFLSVQPRGMTNTAAPMLRQSPRKAVKEKRKYVTLQELQKHQQTQRQGAKKKILLNSQEEIEEGFGESLGRDVEKIRAATIARNRMKIAALGLTELAATFGTSQTTKKKHVKGTQEIQRDKDDSEYIPTDDAMDEAEHRDIVEITTKKTKKGRKTNDEVQNMLAKRITRSRTNSSLQTSTIETDLHQVVTMENEDLRHVVPTPNIGKQLKKNMNEGIGSMEKFMEMRKCQSKNQPLDAMEIQQEVPLSQTGCVGIKQNMNEGIWEPSEERINATEIDQEAPVSNEFCQPKMRRFRGQTRLDSIHTRSLEDRKIINLNGKKQPVCSDGTTLTEFSNFLGTLARTYVRLDHTDWRKVPCKDQLWDFIQQKYVISEEGRPWAMRTMGDAWRVYKCRIKLTHFKPYANDADRRKNRPDCISSNQFENLLKYWNDPKVKKLAEKNTENRSLIKDQHTCGPIGFARIHEKLQKEKPDQAEPSKAELFLETRKRKEGHNYKEADSGTQEKLERIEEKLSSKGENMEPIEDLLGQESSHGREWLVGRMGHIKKTKNSAESSAAPTSSIHNMANDAMEQFKVEVREEVKNEIREEVTNEIRGEMEAQLGAILQRLSLMNPSLNLNLDGILLPSHDRDSLPSNPQDD